MRWSSIGGTSGWSTTSAAGSSLRIAPMRLACDAPSNARLPASISYINAPNANTSVRASTVAPSSCSGAMY